MSDERTPILLDREPLTSALISEWQTIGFLLDDLTQAQWSTPSPLPGWSVQDLVAHLIGTESMLAGIDPPIEESALPDSPHVHNPIGTFNERWIHGLRDRTPAQILALFRDITLRRAETLRTMTQADFDAPTMTPVGPDSYGRFMRIRLFDCWFHELDIRDAIGVPGDEDGVRGEYAFAELLSSVPFAVAKKAQAPRGTSVTFALSGPLAREVHVAVDARATLVDALPGPATTTIAMDSRLFTRLCGGRVSPIERIGEVTITGHEELGLQIATNLAFTI